MLKKRIFEIIEVASPGDMPSKIFDIIILSLIVLNVFAVIVETLEKIYELYAIYFNVLEMVTITIFTVEYILRIWTCNLMEEYKNPIVGRIRFAFTPLIIIDLLAILPFFIPMIIPVDARFLRAIRLFRLLRILKTGRYFESLNMLSRVFRNKKEELIISLSIILVLLIFTSSFMYYIENSAQPEVFSSIPATMWWGIATLTTVGYGDMYPITPIGKFTGGIIAILGIMLFALPTGIFASGFSEEIQRRSLIRKKEKTCPYCGKEMDGKV